MTLKRQHVESPPNAVFFRRLDFITAHPGNMDSGEVVALSESSFYPVLKRQLRICPGDCEANIQKAKIW